MAASTDPSSLQLLRHRFLMEERSRVTEWLWEEHPQTAAFLLDWLGEPGILAAYLAPLPFLQQADVLYRMVSLTRPGPVTPFHEEVLVDALRRLSPYLREADRDLVAEDPPPLRGERLMRAYLRSLGGDDLQRLLAMMEDVDLLLARVGAALCRNARGKEEPRTFHGVLNAYCDLLGHAFTRCFATRTVVYPDRVEMISAEGLAKEEPGQTLPFRLAYAGVGSSMHLMVSPQLFIHYLECTFGAGRPYFLHDLTKAEFSSIESRLALSFAQQLTDYLNLAFGLEEEAEGYQLEEVEMTAFVKELTGYGKTPLLTAQFLVTIGQTQGGRIGLLMPPSHLLDLQAIRGTELFQTLLSGSSPESAPAPEARPAPSPPATAPDVGLDESKEGGRAPDEELQAPQPADGHDDPSGTLEEFLWRVELEEAERASEKSEPRPTQPLDLFMQGYAPKEIALKSTSSHEEQERLAELHYFYGSRLFQKGHYVEAVEAFEHTLAESPGHEGGQLLLAAAWGEQGLYFKEIVAYKKLIAEGRALPETHVLLARRLAFLGRVDDAFSALRVAIDLGIQPQEIVEADPCFRPLRKSVRWRQYLADQS